MKCQTCLVLEVQKVKVDAITESLAERAVC
jgi:hypothetical protein